MILNIKKWVRECVCVCVLVFSTGIPEWSCWRKIHFIADFHVSVNMYRCVWAKRNGSVCLWPEVIWALNIRASVIRFLSKCGKVQLRRVCELFVVALGRTMFNRLSFMFLSVDRVTGDGLVSKSCLCSLLQDPQTEEVQQVLVHVCLCFKWVHEANFPTLSKTSSILHKHRTRDVLKYLKGRLMASRFSLKYTKCYSS